MATLAAALDAPVRLLDVGARGGIDARWKRFHPILDVLGFEPDPEECERLNETASQLPYSSRFLPSALGREDREVDFNVCRWPVASSVFEPNPDFLSDFPHAAALMEVVERRRLRTEPLDAVCARESIAPDCLKIDVEGAELDVLQGAERRSARRSCWTSRWSSTRCFVTSRCSAMSTPFCAREGWRLLGLRRVAWRRTAGLEPAGSGYGGQLVSGDALYYNHTAVVAGLPPTRALKLAIILAAYRQNDFALALLRGRADGAALESAILDPPGPVRRVASRALGRLDSEQRRRLADAAQPGNATVWQDAHHF